MAKNSIGPKLKFDQNCNLNKIPIKPIFQFEIQIKLKFQFEIQIKLKFQFGQYINYTKITIERKFKFGQNVNWPKFKFLPEFRYLKKNINFWLKCQSK